MIDSNKTDATIKNIKRQEEEEKTKKVAEKLDLPYLNLDITPIDSSGLDLIEREEAKQANLIIIYKFGNSLKVAIANPDNKETEQVLAKLKDKGFNTNLFIASFSSLEKAWERFKEIKKERKKITKEVTITPERILQLQQEIEIIKDLQKKLKQLFGMSTTELIELILAGALKIEASDVHFETQKENTRLRYRIDGLLQDIVNLPEKTYNFILSRIKLLSELKINVHDQPQDGRFSIKTKDKKIEIRTSVIPSSYGENIVLRILNPKTIAIKLEELGLEKYALDIIKKQLKKPHGMIINTGPTGSGKTTTLYAFVKKINDPNIKIITLENPIEYHLKGIEQTQVNKDKKYTFATGLKSILRQDPDIILLGEIRDSETAGTAIHAALTGHLVFTTLHTNDAAGAIPRLIDMKVNPKLIPPALNLVIAQRLIRKVCKNCAKEYKPDQKLIKKLKQELKEVPEKIKNNYSKLNKNLKLLKSTKGCKKCNFTGYKGRIAIMELFIIDETMEKFIAKSPSIVEVHEKAVEKGMITLKQDGIFKLLNKITTLKEIERILGL